MAEPSGRFDLKDVLLHGLGQLENSNLSGTVKSLLPDLLGALPKRRGRADLQVAIQTIRADLQSLDAVLDSLQQQLSEAALTLTSDSEPETWWQARQQQIEQAEDEGRRDRALSLWVDAFAEALAAGAIAECVQIVGFGDERDPQLADAMAAILHAGSDGQEALAGLDLLLAESSAALTTSAAVRLEVLRSRQLLALGDADRAAQAAGAAIERARLATAPPSDSLTAATHLLHLEPEGTQASPLEGLALSARAEVHLTCGQLEEAHQVVTAALHIVAAPADVQVAAGMVAEAQDALVLADGHYAEAIKAGFDGRPSLLLSPAPARLKIAQARRCRRSDPELAVALYESILRDGVPDGDEPTADLHVELARLLASTDSARAARAYSDAGEAYSAAGLYARAAECFGRACDLEPSEAHYWWSRSESLRLQAVRAVGVADFGLLERAQQSLSQGLSVADPDGSYAWVHVTRALIEAPLAGPRLEQLVWIERSLLLDENYNSGYFFLIEQFRERGYSREAYEAARQRHARMPWDSHAVVQLARQCIEREKYDEAAAAVETPLWLEPESVDLLCTKALILLRQGKADEAGDLLASAATTPWVRLLRAYAHDMSRNYAAAQREFRKLSPNVRDSDDRALQAWVAFHSGTPERLDEAIDILRSSTGPASAAALRDLGQMLLARGGAEPDDLLEGERLLRTGVAETNQADELVHVETLQLDLLRHRVLGQPHEQRVTEFLDSLADPIIARRTELRQRSLDPESTAGRLARARTALAERKTSGAALDLYSRLIADGSQVEPHVPTTELLLGLSRAADALLESGDAWISDGLEKAELSWRQLDAVTGQLPEVALRLAARRCLAGCVRDNLSDAIGEVQVLLADDDGADILNETTKVFAPQAPMLWAIHEGLEELRRREDVFTETQRDQLISVLKELPFSDAYRLGRGDLSVGTSAPLVALEVRLGPHHHDLADSRSLDEGIPDLRQRILREMGVRIQGVRVTTTDDIGEDRVDFRLYNEDIGHVVLPTATADRVRPVLEGLEKAVRQRLYRLIGPDAINLWLEDWEPSSAHGREVKSYPKDRRLELARMLRMLLREGVPITERDVLLQTFDECDGCDQVNFLRTARLRLGATLAELSPPPARSVLPEQIEDRLRSGLVEPGNRWELSRAETSELVRELREWLAGLPGKSKAIVVTDPGIRPFVWRLLAAERQAVRVLAEEELA